MERLILILGLAAAAAGTARAEQPWELIKTADGIVVERRRVEGSPLKEFRGRGVVRAPISTILAVFSDVTHATEWMDSCSGSRMVADLSDTEKIVYNRTRAPWPVSDRDAVLRNLVTVDNNERVLRLDFETVARADVPPVKGVVRMPYLRGHWYLWPSADGSETRVEYQVHANPGGRLPDWLVNYTSRELPFKTITGLRAQVQRRSYPGFADQLRRHYPQYPFLYEKAAPGGRATGGGRGRALANAQADPRR